MRAIQANEICDGFDIATGGVERFRFIRIFRATETRADGIDENQVREIEPAFGIIGQRVWRCGRKAVVASAMRRGPAAPR